MAKRKMSALQRKYFGKRKSNPRRRRRTVSAAAPRRRRRRNPPNPPARRRRRRNPVLGFSVRGIVGKLQRGAVDAACVVAGRAAVRYAASKTDYPYGSMMHAAVETLTAIGASILVEQVLGSDRARFVLAGGLASPLEEAISEADVPVLSELLGSNATANTAAIYPPADSRSLGAWQDGAQPLGAWQQQMGARRARVSSALLTS